MYGIRFIKGMVLAKANDTDFEGGLILTLKSEDPGSNSIQCLDIERIDHDIKYPNSVDDIMYDNGNVIFYNESDQHYYCVKCTKFRFLNVESSRMVPVFFLSETILNSIIMIFVTTYYGLESTLIASAATAKMVISNSYPEENKPVYCNTDESEDEEEDEENYIDPRYVSSSIYEDTINALEEFIVSWDKDLSSLTYRNAVNFSNAFCLQPLNENRRDMYEAIGVTESEFMKIKRYIMKIYPDLPFKRIEG